MKLLHLLTAATLLLSVPASASTVIGFGTFENTSNDRDFDYLSKILPDSFAVSVESSFDITAVKTADIGQMMKDTDHRLKGSYTEQELYTLTRELPVNYYVYGKFRPIPDERIEISVNIFNKDTSELFSFVNTGRMETEIFNLVDRLTGIFNDFFKEDFRFRSGDISPKSRLAFITNLDPLELNEFYAAFMKDGYRVSPVQGNEPASRIMADHFDKLRHVALKEKSFQRVRSEPPLVFDRFPQDGKRTIAAQRQLKEAITKYLYRYPAEQEKALKELSARCSNHIDYLCIVGFDEDRTKAWIRAFDLTHFDASLIWLQTGVTGDDPDEIASALMRLFIRRDQQ